MVSSPLADSGHDKLKALVVDDEKNIRTMLSLCLEQMGCKVTAASSAESALAADTAAL
jgi:CheY-like chemotaxis protein